jgi:hypothetical protein
MTVRLTPEAEADLSDVFAWYSERGEALGLEFLAAVTDVLRRIDRFPHSAWWLRMEKRQERQVRPRPTFSRRLTPREKSSIVQHDFLFS